MDKGAFDAFEDGYCIHAVLADCEFVLDAVGASLVYEGGAYQTVTNPFTDTDACPELVDVLTWALHGLPWGPRESA